MVRKETPITQTKLSQTPDNKLSQTHSSPHHEAHQRGVIWRFIKPNPCAHLPPLTAGGHKSRRCYQLLALRANWRLIKPEETHRKPPQTATTQRPRGRHCQQSYLQLLKARFPLRQSAPTDLLRAVAVNADTIWTFLQLQTPVASALMHAGGWPIPLLYQPEVPPPPADRPISVRERPEVGGVKWAETCLFASIKSAHRFIFDSRHLVSKRCDVQNAEMF